LHLLSSTFFLFHNMYLCSKLSVKENWETLVFFQTFILINMLYWRKQKRFAVILWIVARCLFGMQI
jgi:hypothetical protein